MTATDAPKLRSRARTVVNEANTECRSAGIGFVDMNGRALAILDRHVAAALADLAATLAAAERERDEWRETAQDAEKMLSSKLRAEAALVAAQEAMREAAAREIEEAPLLENADMQAWAKRDMELAAIVRALPISNRQAGGRVDEHHSRKCCESCESGLGQEIGRREARIEALEQALRELIDACYSNVGPCSFISEPSYTAVERARAVLAQTGKPTG